MSQLEANIDLPKTVLVIDDDEVVRNLVANYLGALGIADIDMQSDGPSGWKALQEKKYEFVILDWKLRGLSGIALFNRMRRLENYRTTPVLVISGLLEREDFRLLQEYPITTLLEKPFTKTLLIRKINELYRESIWYDQNAAMMSTVMELLPTDTQKAMKLLQNLMSNAPNPIPLGLIGIRRLRENQFFREAEELSRNLLQRDQGCVLAMGELGKIYCQTGRHAEAVSVLRSAQSLSPQNLERLCLMGEAHLNLADPDQARQCFQNAMQIDGDDEKAKAGVVLAENMKQHFISSPERQALPQSFASLLNVIGISMVRSGKFGKGIEQYRSALAFLTTGEASARLSFNLGLGFLRWGKPQDALPWFERSVAESGGAFSKSNGYAEKLRVIVAQSGLDFDGKLAKAGQALAKSAAKKPVRLVGNETAKAKQAKERPSQSDDNLLEMLGEAEDDAHDMDQPDLLAV